MRIFFFFLIAMSTLGTAQDTYQYTVPVPLHDGWDVAHITTQSIDLPLLEKFFNSIPKNKGHNIHSILIVKNNKLVLEEYFDQYNSQKKHDLRSVTKSITSLLLGIAIDKGFIESVDDPIIKYLPEYQSQINWNDQKDKITIRHLLSMSSGLACNDWDRKSKGQEDKMYKTDDWVRFALDLPMDTNPGDTSLYCTANVIILGAIISNATAQNLDDFSDKFLFKPLGITDYQWSYIKKTKKVDSGGHLYLTPRSMAKIGQLILNKGKWGEEQIVSEKWIEQSIAVHTQIQSVDYGYLWWKIPFGFKGEKIFSICATGNGGQYIMILPQLNLVTVFTGGNYNSEKAQVPFTIFQQIILPAQVDEGKIN
ncbi:serine hydrolase [candidate division KSB1 bacterium]|nr:serine hydrolase [candidate division KSB1 bacterium]